MDPQSSSSASPSMSRLNYDAFLSFRGVDTRRIFISHLYHALEQKGVDTFKDSEELEAGQRRSELFEAIKGSRVAVVTFSENYARSKWCLDELQKIMECKGQGKLTVIPIFYHMSPREVRLHKKENGEKGCYQIAMEEMEAKYGGMDSETVARWRKVLWEGGDLIGIEVVSGQDEGDVVQDVVERVKKIINHVPLEVAKHPVGIDCHLTEIRRSLHIDSHFDDVCMLGLLGPGGAGKTTLSKAICNDIFDRFDNWCFLANVRETTSRVFNGLAKLQQELLRELLSDKNLEVSNVDVGKTLIKKRLSKKNVLIILDDVEESIQLEALAGDLDWFGSGSRIILTTRNERVLTENKVPKYEVNLLKEEEADDLFRHHAFGKQDKINIDCGLIDRFIEYAGKLPLALVVLGASLRGRSISEWEGKLKELKDSPDEAINKVLKISYEGLEKKHKEIFLDVACLFKGMNMDEVVKILDGCGFAASLGLTKLRERCLITIVDRQIEMHDLLVDMGRSISCDNDHGIPSRIWFYEDFWKILLDERSTQERLAVEGIVLPNRSENDDRLVKFSTLKDFKKLRILTIKQNVVCTEEPLQLPRELRWLEWRECSAPAIEFYQSSELVSLNLYDSKIQQIKQTGLEKLKYLRLSNCRSLKNLPDLSDCRDLEDLKLSYCNSLRRIEQIKTTGLEKLKYLRLSRCTSLETLSDFSSCRDLEYLHLNHCDSLKRIEQIKATGLEKLKKLRLSWCPSLETLPDLSGCRDLEYLDLDHCDSLKRIEQIKATGLEKLKYFRLSWCTSLETLPDLSGYRDLEDLNLSYCNSLTRIEQIKATGLEKMKYLRLSWCTSLETLPDLSDCRNLEDMKLSCCNSLRRIEQIKATGLEKLKFLRLSRCSSLEMIPDLSSCRDLEYLHLNHCDSLKRIEQIKATGLEKLKYLRLSRCTSLETLPDLSGCRDLEDLNLSYCNSLTRIEQIKVTGLEKLKYLRLSWCTSLETLPDLSGCRDLEDLKLNYCNGLTRIKQIKATGLEKLKYLRLSWCTSLETFPDLSNCRDLEDLNLSYCNSLTRLEQIKATGLEKLKYLRLSGCTSLETLPDLSRCRDLRVLDLFKCDSLTRLDEAVGSLEKLVHLKLCRCGILSGFPRRAPGAAKDVYGFPNLEILSIAYCKLKDVEFLDDLTCFETLTELRLSGNEFTHVPASISKFKNLQVLGLDGCDRLVEVPELPNVPYLNVAELPGRKCFRVNLSNSRSLDSSNINRLLSLENVRRSVGAMSVFFPGEEFPHWVKFQSGEFGSCYRVSLTREILEDDLIGLALFFSFTHVDSSPNEWVGGCKVEVRVNREDIIWDFCGKVVGVHSGCVYIPCQSLVQRDGDLASELNSVDITLEISALVGVVELRSWGMRLLCKREEEDDLIKVLKDGDDSDDSPGLENQSGWRTQSLQLRVREMNRTKRLKVR